MITDSVETSRRISPYEEAQHYYDLGFNVFPVIPLGKRPLENAPMSSLSSCRMPRILLDCFADDMGVVLNMAIMCGEVSGGLVVIDCDSEESFRTIRGRLDEICVKTWIRSSKRGGHFWFICHDRTHTSKAGDVQLLSHGSYVVAPPSTDKFGDRYFWVERPGEQPATIRGEDLRFLCPELFRPGYDGDSPLWQQVIIKGRKRVTKGGEMKEYHSHSEAEYSACMSMANDGYSEEEIIAAFRQHRPPHFRKVKEPNFVRNILRPALRKVADSPAEKGRRDLQRLSVDDFTIPKGRTRTTDIMVLDLLIYRRSVSRSDTFRAAIREMAQTLGMDKNTILSSMHRMQSEYHILCKNENEYYTLAPNGRDPRPDNLPAPTPAQDAAMDERWGVSYDIIDPSLDGWRRNALGPTGCLAYNALEFDAYSIKELTAKLNMSYTAVRNAMNKLREWGFAEKDASTGKWRAIRASMNDLDAAAEHFCTNGRRERQIYQHTRERERYIHTMMLNAVVMLSRGGNVPERLWRDALKRGVYIMNPARKLLGLPIIPKNRNNQAQVDVEEQDGRDLIYGKLIECVQCEEDENDAETHPDDSEEYYNEYEYPKDPPSPILKD